MLAAHGRALAAAEKKFGMEVFYRAVVGSSSGRYLIAGQFDAGNWKINGDSAYGTLGGGALSRRDGHWRYNAGIQAAAVFDGYRARDEAFLKDLDAGKFKTAREALEHMSGRNFMLPFLF